MHFDHGIYTHATNVTIINNVFYNMSKGWSVEFADGAANYLIANNAFAFPNASGEPGQIMFWNGNSNIQLTNNIFYQPTGSALTQFAATITAEFDHNLVYGKPALPLITAGREFRSAAGTSWARPDVHERQLSVQLRASIRISCDRRGGEPCAGAGRYYGRGVVGQHRCVSGVRWQRTGLNIYEFMLTNKGSLARPSCAKRC